MPPETDYILAPTTARYQVALSPALNMLNDLMLLNKIGKLSGLDSWVSEIDAQLTPRQRQANRLVTIGLHYALVPDRDFESFPAYLDDLATCPPESLRDQLLARLVDAFACDASGLAPQFQDPAFVGDSLENYIAFLDAAAPHYDRELETQAYGYIADPPALQAVIVEHLQDMWDDFLAEAWARSEPVLQECVAAFQHVDVTGLGPAQVIHTITGQDHLAGKAETPWLDSFEQFVFVPSVHIGPYLGKLHNAQTIWLFFGARQPEGARGFSPDLSRSELLVWLNALADDTRLRILGLLVERGELCAQDIITQLDLSQSAASRHLRQLSATGYLVERRREGAKCYSLNSERVERTLHALEYFLLGK